MAHLIQGMCLLPNIRESSGVTQSELTKNLKKLYGVSISVSHLSRMERGERPMTTLQKRAICLALNCTEADLYDWKLQ
ncbi:helix-turn-helix transcriptional regulator [Paenibacillus sp. FSL H8-0259]|uniref:helix-turn-helix domain-containing protein n=2 Tax=Paenibacillus TaxID=44249 RepID=UPI00118135A5